jgi:exopolysaccharide biosynthesis polyprenyl glycosylphosphotransferase
MMGEGKEVQPCTAQVEGARDAIGAPNYVQMIRRHRALLRWLLVVSDAIAALILIVGVSTLRFGDDSESIWNRIFANPWAPAAVLTAGWLAVLWSQGLYSLATRRSFRAQAVAMVKAFIVFVLATFAALYVMKLPDVSRTYLLVLLPSMAVASLALRGLIDLVLIGLQRMGRSSRHVLVVGSGANAVTYARELHANPSLGLRVIGFVNGDGQESSMGVPYLGPITELPAVLHNNVVDEVAVCIDLADWQVVEGVIESCRAEGKVVRVPLAGAFMAGAATYVEDLAGIPVLSLLDRPDRQLALAIKRLVDFAVASIGLTIGMPIFVLAGLAVLIGDGRPILFRQERVGLHGRQFRLVKFRTMVRDAELQRSGLLHRNERIGPAFKVTNDPRITRVGRFLRRTSLDELPQLWNVLIGQMSLIGPRPPLPSEVDEYDIWHRRRLSMKPGITGLWQVEARREADFDRWVQRDLEYIDSWSLWLDTKIAARTVPAMLRFEGR